MKTKLLIFFSLAFIIAVIGLLVIPKTIKAPTLTPIKTNVRISSCPEGYIYIPGNPSYKTQDFCVMKYDAKCSNPDPKCLTSEGVYKNNQKDCGCEGNFYIMSKSEGSPITFIPEDDASKTSAKMYCKNVNAHLINNNEWMTVARNIEQVNANWCDRNGTGCGNAPGSEGKILANGHNDSLPNKALPEGPDDQPCFGTTSDGSNECGEGSSQKRTLTLSNGQIIWDFAGNVWQWVDVTVARKDEPRSIIPNVEGTGFVWAEFQTVPYSDDFDPSNAAWGSKQGMGRIYHYNLMGDTDKTIYTFIRGGNWRHGYDSGAFTVHMQPVPGKTNIDDVGFRCVTSPTP